MTSLSNLYIEKVLSEHPIATWSLGDDVGYRYLISETNRDFANPLIWSLDSCTSELETLPKYGVAFPNSKTFKIIGDLPVGEPKTYSLVSQFAIDESLVDLSLGNFTIGFYIYIDNPYTTSVSFGYRYSDTVLNIDQDVLENIQLKQSDSKRWIFISKTFAFPTNAFDDFKFLINITAKEDGELGDYVFYLNGLTSGQWAEDFASTSLGTDIYTMPTNIALPEELNVVPAIQYGTKTNPGYYLADDLNIFSQNVGIPLVYGSSNITKILPNKISSTTYPSIIFPGLGFLNEKGKNNTYTAEMWIKINTDTNTPRKIFGTIASNDGLYVDGAFLSFVFAGKFKSHYVGEWGRPMLIHIRFIKNNVSVLLNGEEIISLFFIEEDLNLPLEFSESGKSQDWVGFYTYEDIHPFEIDCFAIYSYVVGTEIAKRRWVWGQGVVAPETTNYAQNAVTIFNDYSFTNYSVNHNYPDYARWDNGFASNIDSSSAILKLPNYNLPEFFLGSKTYDQWIDDLTSQQVSESSKFFSFRPNTSWNDQKCYIKFNNLNVINEKLRFFYGLFKSDGSSINEPILKITNKVNSDYFLITLNGTSLVYSITLSGVQTTIATKQIVANSIFPVGINISKLIQKDIDGIDNFFAILSNLTLLVGGDNIKTFSGKIYRFGFDGSYNLQKINADYFDTSGLCKIGNTERDFFLDYTSNYSLELLYKYNLLFADIRSSGYWQDYIPLSFFAKTTVDYKNKEYYDLDFLQINLDYPEAIEQSFEESVGEWTYQDLKVRYQTFQGQSFLQSYSYLDNSLYNGWEDYQDMSEDSEKYKTYNTSNNTIRAYISFQKIKGAEKRLLSNFANIEKMNINGVVDPSASKTGWENTAFEITNGAIIYPPRFLDNEKTPIDFNKYSISIHLDVDSDGIIHNPISFRNFQIASKVFERNRLTALGSKFGNNLYPYSKTGLYYDFKAKNPIETYKGSTPYLYLNNNSGWHIKGSSSPLTERGISIPINSQKSLSIRVGTLQLWTRFAEATFPTVETLFMSINHKKDIYDFYIIADESSIRGKIFGKSRSTGELIKNIKYSNNGKLVATPYILSESWNVLGIGFNDLLDFGEYSGSINITGPVMFNNLSYYLANNLQQEQQIESRSWSSVQADDLTWEYWSDPLDINSDGDYLDPGEHSGIWEDLYIISSTSVYNIAPEEIYSQYVGTNRIIVDDGIDGILVNPEKISLYSGLSWSVTTNTPV